MDLRKGLNELLTRKFYNKFKIKLTILILIIHLFCTSLNFISDSFVNETVLHNFQM